MLRIAALFSLLLFSLYSHAESDIYNRVDFQVEVAQEVSNNLLVAVMSAEIRSNTPGLVAQKLNTTLNDALKKSASFTMVKIRSGNQSTHPVYDKNNQVKAWLGRAQIHLESPDFKAASELIMHLQDALQLTSLKFSLAPDTKLKIENTLIIEAIKAFQHRAEAIRTAAGAQSYKTVHFSINSENRAQPYSLAQTRKVMMSNSSIPAPAFSGGESRMKVRINGTIQLQ